MLQLKLLNTRSALWLPSAAGSRLHHFRSGTFFAGLPEELFESARIDGATELRVLLAWPSPPNRLWFVALLQVYGVSNDWSWPLTVITGPT